MPKMGKFPEKKPNVPPDQHGWFRESNQVVLKEQLNSEMGCIIELGSWLGKSTRFICEHAPNAAVYAIDHWEGSPEHHQPHRLDVKDKLATLYETFIVNCWELRDRIKPLRMDTKIGLRRCSELGLKPELIYIDAGHDYQSVFSDMALSKMYFPEAILVGDDWDWQGVRAAVINYCHKQKMRFHVYGNCWWVD